MHVHICRDVWQTTMEMVHPSMPDILLVGLSRIARAACRHNPVRKSAERPFWQFRVNASILLIIYKILDARACTKQLRGSSTLTTEGLQEF